MKYTCERTTHTDGTNCRVQPSIYGRNDKADEKKQHNNAAHYQLLKTETENHSFLQLQYIINHTLAAQLSG